MDYLSRRMALGLIAGGALALATGPSLAVEKMDYTPQALAALKASGKPYLLDFYAPWCGTCRVQERVIGQLQEENADYLKVTVMRVDWDSNRTGDLVRDLGIPRRSTLVLFKGDTELGRIVAQTGKDKIAALMDIAI